MDRPTADRRQFLALAGATATTVLAGCDGDEGQTPTETTIPDTLTNPSFESGLDGWTIGRDLPEDPNNAGEPVDSSVAVTDRVASDGDRALACTIDGSADDGTVWVEQRVDLSGVSEVSVDGFSAQESFNTIAKLAVYAGPDPDGDLTESDFDTSKATEDHEGWETYTYDVDHDGPGLVAVGISVVWETEVTRVLDDVRLD
ncbi:hypothetical protein [Halococcoides cellulosivorans]|uniref:Uncharacterized protein n=1 Tax=Halococcoides cellulosivorans TaxID=1679096 RepID=A0A2R4X1T9_9EURY|nr:hypothetical protein [Halococcoides cellulosivorans]AWB27738.1 hypothetical protein HARCEL1_08455 [Halococcoides cellulosivorans]